MTATKKPTRAKSDVLYIALRNFGYLAAIGFFAFMFAPVMMSETKWLRLLFDGALILIAAMLFFVEGSYKGERDCAMTALLDKRKRETGYVPDLTEQRKRYHAPKGLYGALLGAAPWFVLAVFVAVLAKPYTYILQDLPGWLGGYALRPEVGKPLQYYGQIYTVAPVEYLRVISRFSILPFVYLPGNLSDAGSLLIDRMSPLLVLILPLCNAIGYLFGPRRFQKTLKFIADAKAKPRRRLKKKVQERLKKAPDDPEKNRLI
ncbi:MAG: hypothetical protein RR482_02390 [Clostridia bacterium]